MPDSDIQRLVERIEGASEGSRELDVAIGMAVAGFFVAEPRYPGAKPMIGYVDKDGSRVEPGNGAQDSLVPRYTASIDAAMTLIPDGWSLSLGEMRGMGKWRAWLNDHNTPDGLAVRHVDADAATAPIALASAALRARITERTDIARNRPSKGTPNV